ncbi:MAG: hypothetical protein RL522_2009 [Pseudomonadota bacterium]|jgi:G3E family GTPase
MRPVIPLTVIGGFLGAGKTTLLNHLLTSQVDRRIAVLVNDFGELNIDARLIASRHGDTVELSNGCVCCSIGDDLSRALIQVLDASSALDAVIIEASGVSDPRRIARLAKAAPELSVDAVLVMVDASMVLAQARDPYLADTLQRQLVAADLLVLNKIDLTNKEQRELVLALLRQQAPGTPVVEAVQARVPDALVSGLGMSPQRLECWWQGRSLSAETEHEGGYLPQRLHPMGAPEHDDRFQAWLGLPQHHWSFAQWEDALQALVGRVLRLKGQVHSQDEGWLEVQLAGRQVRLSPAPASLAQSAQLVAIGLRGQLPLAALESLGETDPSRG